MKDHVGLRQSKRLAQLGRGVFYLTPGFKKWTHSSSGLLIELISCPFLLRFIRVGGEQPFQRLGEANNRRPVVRADLFSKCQLVRHTMCGRPQTSTAGGRFGVRWSEPPLFKTARISGWIAIQSSMWNPSVLKKRQLRLPQSKCHRLRRAEATPQARDVETFGVRWSEPPLFKTARVSGWIVIQNSMWNPSVLKSGNSGCRSPNVTGFAAWGLTAS